jgi:hypothetical protein
MSETRPSFRLEDVVLKNEVSEPVIGKSYMNDRFKRYWETSYGDNTFCLPLFFDLGCDCDDKHKCPDDCSTHVGGCPANSPDTPGYIDLDNYN